MLIIWSNVELLFLYSNWDFRVEEGGKSSLPLANLTENNINKGRHFVWRSKMHSLRLPMYFGRIREGKTALNLGVLPQDAFAKDKRGQKVGRLWA